MDKTEYQLKLNELTRCVQNREYAQAQVIAEGIDWRRVKSIRTLNMVADIFEVNKEYEKCRDILKLALTRASVGKALLFRMTEINLKLGDIEEAEHYYSKFIQAAPHDNSRFILQYRLLKAKRAPIGEQIAVLEDYKDREYTERWAYELAALYGKAGETRKCVDECDDLILWFTDGNYVTKALSLKSRYEALTPAQQQQYEKGMQESSGESEVQVNVPQKTFTEQFSEVGKNTSGPSVMERIQQAGAAMAKDVTVADAAPEPAAPEEVSAKADITSKEFMGTTVNLKEQLARSIDKVFSRKKLEPYEEEQLLSSLAEEESRKAGIAMPEMTAAAAGAAAGAAAASDIPAEEPDQVEGQMSFADFDLDSLFSETAAALSAEVSDSPVQSASPDSIPDAAEIMEEPAGEMLKEAAAAEPVKEAAETAAEIAEETAAAETVAEPVKEAEAAAAEAVTEAAEPVKEAEEVRDFMPEAAALTGSSLVERVSAPAEFDEDIFDKEEPAAEAAPAEEPAAEAAEAAAEPAAEAVEAAPAEEVIGTAAAPAAEAAEEVVEAAAPAAEAAEEVMEAEAPAAEAAEAAAPAEEAAEAAGAAAIAAAAGAMAAAAAAEAEAPKRVPIYNEELEIPDPEPTPEERISRTIPLGKVGQNTVPISIEEVLKQETTEERRIRILNNGQPTRMNDEQRRIFTYFARVPGMDQQILEAMSGAYEYAGEHTSNRGNIAIMGSEGTGKTRLTQGLITAMCRDMNLEAVKTARIEGFTMNQKDPAKIVGKMAGGFLIIEGASDMKQETVEKLSRAMEFRTDCMILIIEDEKSKMRSLLSREPEFAKKFAKVISIPVFTNDELVTFARTYATENRCEMDELGTLALYTRISNNQSEEEPVTIAQVKEIMDEAIGRAKKGSRRFGRAGKKNKEKIFILHEKDFALE